MTFPGTSTPFMSGDQKLVLMIEKSALVLL